jgi:hypothetical protein
MPQNSPKHKQAQAMGSNSRRQAKRLQLYGALDPRNAGREMRLGSVRSPAAFPWLQAMARLEKGRKRRLRL